MSQRALIGVYDLTKLDFEGIRKRRRRHLLLWSLPVVLVVSIVMVICALPGLLTTQASQQYKAGEYEGSLRSLMVARAVSLGGHYGTAHNFGSAQLGAQKYPEAKESFELALGMAKGEAEQCREVRSLTWTMEKWGDGDFGKMERKTDVIQRYTAALSLMKQYASCITDKDAKARLEQKLEAAKAAKGSDGTSSDPQKADTQEITEVQKQQQQKSQQALAKRKSEERYMSGDYTYVELPKGVKPW